MTTGLAPALEYHVVNSLGWSALRPLQQEAVVPIRRGNDAVLVAPTAGGKTEAALFPLLSEMVEQDWRGMSVLYVTPLRALLNNLHPRIGRYAMWLGRTAGLWHGDVLRGSRRRMLAEPPDLLLTTPESIEAMLVSTTLDHRAWFMGVRAVVVDELHAFAGDDRGWHLLAVLERVQRLAGQRLQRVGLSATVGNPDELLHWLGGGVPPAGASVVAPEAMPAPMPDVTLDFVGSVANAAKVVAGLHQGEKRLVFCESRARAESIASELRAREVTTFVSHSSLSAAERRRTEHAFAEARDCVIVATSTLELGVDIGDLDRVIQVDAPRTVASFLQRLGRTGRRPGTSRNTLFLATTDDAFLQAAGLLRLWNQGWVEPVVPPTTPRHIGAQQLLALALQEGTYGRKSWHGWWGELAAMDGAAGTLEYLVDKGFLALDADLVVIGPQAEASFGLRHFLDLTSVFTVAPELRVVHGREDVGTVSNLTLATALPPGQPRIIALAGRAWRVTHTDWRRQRVHVVPVEGAGRSRWEGRGVGLSGPVAQSMRSVLLEGHADLVLSRRATVALDDMRETYAHRVWSGGTVINRSTGGMGAARWWTWAGVAVNNSLAGALSGSSASLAADSLGISLDQEVTAYDLERLREATDEALFPPYDDRALRGLKFGETLPIAVAREVLQRRLGDAEGARDVARQPVRSTMSVD